MTQPQNPALAAVVARDRVQHFIVEALAGRQRTRRRLVFKGGTLLRTCWHHDYRYSEDLDFDWVTDPAETREERRDFAAIFDSVDTLLEDAIAAEPERDPSPQPPNPSDDLSQL